MTVINKEFSSLNNTRSGNSRFPVSAGTAENPYIEINLFLNKNIQHDFNFYTIFFYYKRIQIIRNFHRWQKLVIKR